MLRPLTWAMVLAVSSQALAHDIWIETSKPRYEVNELVQFNIMVGNHGNHHRDFKLASVLKRDTLQFRVSNKLPGSFDISSNRKLVEDGSDKYWRSTAQFLTGGLYVASTTFDQVMSYGPVRDIKSAKTYFWIGKQDLRQQTLDYRAPLGHALEVVPITDPAKTLEAGKDFTVQINYKGKPAPGIVVSFIPKNEVLAGEFDPVYQRVTNSQGQATYRLAHYGQHLIAAHLQDQTAKGEGYDRISYSATLHLQVPNP